MNSITRITATRLRIAAVAAVLAAGVVALTGCAGGVGTSGATQYQNAETSYEQLVIDGDQVIYLTTGAEHIVDLIAVTDKGEIDPDGQYVKEIGTLNEARDTVVWSDGDDDSIQIEDDMVRLDDEIYIPYEDDRAASERERVVAEKS